MKRILLYLFVCFLTLQLSAQSITFQETGGWLESAFVKWTPVAGATSYNVYYTGGGQTNKKIDNPLIRSYGTYFRADIPGLAAGSYTIKVAPVTANVEGTATTTSSLSVLAHDRTGFAFDSGRVPGGYQADGTPKAGAVILYITQNTKNTISMNITGATANPCVGLQNILYAIKKGSDTRPFIIRLIGNITDMDVMEGGDITIENNQNANSYLTIEGIGSDAVVNGMGIRLKSASNIEVRNLGFMNCDSTAGDDVGMQQDNDHIWVHNCDLYYGAAGSAADQIKGDGAMDNKGSTYCTYSYNHFWDNGKSSLLGLSENTTVGLYVTYHHNWFDHSDSRHPRIRFYSAHVYNNYYDGNSKYGVGSTMGSSVFVEGNYFRNTKHPMMTSLQGTDVWDETAKVNNAGAIGTFSSEEGGTIKAFNNYFDASIATNSMRFVAYGDPSALYNITGKISSVIDFDAYVVANRGDQVPATVTSFSGANSHNNFDTDTKFYIKNLVIDTPTAARDKAIAYAGRVSSGDLKFTFTNSVDDTSSEVNTTIKTALTNYATAMVFVQGEATTTAGSQTLTSTTNNNQTVASTVAIGSIVFTWGGDATDATVTGLPASGISFVKDATAKTITISGTPTATLSYSIATSGSLGTSATGSGTITVTSISTGSEIHNFTTSGKTSPFYTISGNMNTTAGSQTYDSLSLTANLKMETATSITYTTTSVSTLTLVFDTSFNGAVKLNTVSYTAVNGLVIIPSIPAGANTITKGSTANLFYIKTVYTGTTPTTTAQTITFSALGTVNYGAAAFNLTATASSSLAVSYTSSNTAVATVSGNTLSIVGAGSTNITASQLGNSSYSAASTVVQALTVNAKNLTIANPVAQSKTYDGTTTASITGTLSGVINADVVTLVLSGTYPNATPGTGKAVSSNSTLTGTNAANYVLTQPTGLTADITVPAPTANAQTFCGAATVADLVATGTSLKWYAASTNGTALTSATALVTGTYYASQTLAGVEGTSRTSIAVTLSPLTTTGSVTTIINTGGSYTWPANGLTYTTAQTNLTYTVGCNTASLNLTVKTAKTDVWDFGATSLDSNLYNNKLSVSILNGLLGSSATAATTNLVGNTTFTTGVLSWTGSSDRLRTTNTALTRYDTNVASVTDYAGRLYANGTVTVTNGLPGSKYLTMTLAEDDEITLIARCDTAPGTLTFVLESNYLTQKDTYATTAVSGATTEVKFVAKSAGAYRIYDATNKASFFRIYRKAANYTSITGTIDVTQAPELPSTYSVLFTNAAGKVWTAAVTSGTYSVSLPAGYTYQMSLSNANGYLLTNGDSLAVTSSTSTYNITLQKAGLFAVSGTITGLGTDISKATLVYTPSTTKVYVPKPVINTVNATYALNLEANTSYTISALGVNDYQIPSNTITITGATTAAVAFTPKTKYGVTITTSGLTTTQSNNLTVTFTNLNETGYAYTFAAGAAISLRNGTYAVSCSGLDSSMVMALTSNLTIANAATSKTLNFTAAVASSSIPYTATITVGTNKNYPTINAALAAITRMTSRGSQRVTVMIDPGNYEEMIEITQANISFKNAASIPSISLMNKGVTIDPAAVRITSYYGHGYNYYSMSSDQKWHSDVLSVNKENGYLSYQNTGAGTTNNSYWNATLIVSANGFEANDIIIENSYNQYISKKESEDVVVMWDSGSKGLRPSTIGSTAVQDKAYVERAAAIAIKNNIDKVVLNKCRVVGRQDSFFGGTGARVVVNKGVMMGSTDYIFGGMDAVFYKSDLAMNTSDAAIDASYITAPQQSTGRGYLMYGCKVTTAIPAIETASVYRSKPGYFGRLWAATTSEVVFYNTTIETSNYTGSEGLSLITPLGWLNSLSGESAKMYEYGTTENSGANNTSSRAAWATKLSAPTLSDGTAITPFNFTKGTDNWDPLPQLIADGIAAPTAVAQSFCGAATVANLVASGTALKWYAAAGGTALDSSVALVSGTTYYVSQTIDTYESTARTSVVATINPLTTTGSVTTSICSGATYHWNANNTDYTTAQSGVTVVSGCNTATLNLTVTPKPTTVVTSATICSGEAYTWSANSAAYTTSQTVTITNDGCTADQVLHLTVTPKPTTVVSNATICSGETYTWSVNGQTYTTSQTVTVTNNGCTANQVLHLTVTPKPTTVVTDATICSGTTYTWAVNGLAYTTSQTVTITNDGCTANQVLHLTVTPKPTAVVTDATICSGTTYTWSVNGLAYTTSQTVIITKDGCTANQVLNLTVTPKPTTVATDATICSGETYTWSANGLAYTTSQTVTITNDGCTANQVLHLTVTPKPTAVVTDATICSGTTYTWSVNGLAYTTSQNVTVTNDGCTANQVLHLTVTPAPNAGTDGTLNVATGVTPTDSQLFATLTGADAGGSWSHNGLVYTYTVAANSPCAVNDIATVKVTEVIPSTFSVCAGTSVASVVGTSSLKFYAALTGGTAILGTTPLALTKTYFVTQLVGGIESSPRKSVVVTVNALPATPTALVLTNDAAPTTAVTAVGVYVGTNTPFKLTATAVGASSYVWTLPSGVLRTNATGSTTDSNTTSTDGFIYVKFSAYSSTTPTPLVINVKSVNASGCISASKASAPLTRLLPIAPAALVMTNGETTTPITSFANYMGTHKVLTLTATPSLTATSYSWELPAGVTQLTGGNSNVITIDLAGVTTSNTVSYTTATAVVTNVLRIGVKAVNAVGSSITPNVALLNPSTDSTAKLLTLTASAPAAPATLVLTNLASTTPATAVTIVSKYIGTTTELTLTAAASPLANSYSWEIPTGVNIVSGSDLTSRSIKVNFASVSKGTTALVFGVKAINAMGSSLSVNLAPNTDKTAKLLTVTAALPAAVLTVSGSTSVCNRTDGFSYTITAPVGATSYVITAPLGSVVSATNGVSGSTPNVLTTSDLTFKVVYSGTTPFTLTDKSIVIRSANGLGLSIASKSIVLTKLASCVTLAGVTRFVAPSVTESFNVTAYPNPSSDVFRLEVQASTKGKSTTDVQVYDMIGRLIEQRQLESNSVELGGNYPSGVYNIIVTQDNNLKSLRLIKN